MYVRTYICRYVFMKHIGLYNVVKDYRKQDCCSDIKGKMYVGDYYEAGN